MKMKFSFEIKKLEKQNRSYRMSPCSLNEMLTVLMRVADYCAVHRVWLEMS